MKNRRNDLRVALCTFSVESLFLLFFCYLLRFSPAAQLQDYPVPVGGLGGFQLSEQQWNEYV